MKIIVDNLAVEYENEGNPAGPVLLFLHGWRNDLHSFDAVSRDLAASCRIIRLDLPGFGGTELPHETWELDDYVRFVADFVKKLDISVDVLCGHSLGGRIVIKGLGSGAFRPKKAVLIASAGIAKKKTWRNRMLKVVAKTGKAATSVPPFSLWQSALKRKLYAHAGSDYNNAGSLKNTFVKVVGEDLGASAQKIVVPVLLIWGDRDTETTLSDGVRLSHLISGSVLKVFPSTGHHVHQEKSEEVARAIKVFMTQHND